MTRSVIERDRPACSSEAVPRTEDENIMVKMNGRPPRTGTGTGILALGIALPMVWIGLTATAMAAGPSQMTFSSPEEAAETLVTANRASKMAELEKILGPSGRKLIFSGDEIADKEGRDKFTAAYDQSHVIDKQSESLAILIMGTEQWPFPIPIVKQSNTWTFDTKSGEEEILNRRIGRNEINAIQVCSAIVDAEHDYASKAQNGNNDLEYAQKFMSSPGKHDGLFWPVTADEEQSPIGPLVVSARAEGYPTKNSHDRRTPYHGYFYKLLTRQGKDAPGGALNYVVHGHMIGGFALVAFPATYGDSGVMTFIVDHDGLVYEKNLGPSTKKIASAMTTYNPDPSWSQLHP